MTHKISALVTQDLLIWRFLEEVFYSLQDVEVDTFFFSPLKVENDYVIAVLDVNLVWNKLLLLSFFIKITICS